MDRGRRPSASLPSPRTGNDHEPASVDTVRLAGMLGMDGFSGLNPANDGKLIRLVIPELNEERRRELNKLVRKTAEESKVAIRSIRRDAMDQIKKLEKESTITEDEQHRAENELQKVTDEAVKDIDKLADEKEKEIMEV